MRILVVCGAGASSTFVAQRLRHAAQAAGRRISALAGTERSLPIDLDAADIVLVGPHLQHALDRIGQLTMRNLDIADSRSKLETYASRGQLLANHTQLIGELEPGRAGAITGGASESEGEQWLDAAAIESGTD